MAAKRAGGGETPEALKSPACLEGKQLGQFEPRGLMLLQAPAPPTDNVAPLAMTAWSHETRERTFQCVSLLVCLATAVLAAVAVPLGQ